MQSMLVRLSIPGTGPHGGPNPHAAYGDQLQNEGILGRVPPEGDPRLTWATHTIAFADGEIVSLRAPILEFWHLSFGPLGADVMTSARVAPAIVGVGLLDAVAERTVLARAAMQRELGLSGRANLVWDLIDEREAVGRFGRKANQPSLKQQIVTAYHADLGVTSRWFPEENCTEVQIACLQQKPGGYPELPPALLDPVLFYTQALAVPARVSLLHALHARPIVALRARLLKRAAILSFGSAVPGAGHNRVGCLPSWVRAFPSLRPNYSFKRTADVGLR